MNLQKKIKIIISGGGTGGHIFPAIAIADELKKMESNIEILFVGAQGKMEMEKVPAAGYKIEGLWISGLQRNSFTSNLSFPLKIMASLYKAGKIINDFKPAVAVGVGGFASGPLLYMAAKKNIPALIQEQNSYPGITNRLLAKKASRICVAYDGMEKYFPEEKIIKTGNPVRSEMVDIQNKKLEAVNYFGLNEIKTVLVMGGSQGARSINHAIKADFNRIKDSGIQLIWQTGKSFYGEAQELVSASGCSSIKVYEFINRMDLAYAIADLVVSRAGAGTVSELSIVSKPALMVPLATAAEDHQTKNCLSLVNKHAALLVKDSDVSMQLVSLMLETIKNDELLISLSQNISRHALPGSAKKIAAEVLQLMINKN